MLIIAARRARDAEAEERYSRMFAERGRTPGAREGFAEEVRVNARLQNTRPRTNENAAQNIGKALLYTQRSTVVPCGRVS